MQFKYDGASHTYDVKDPDCFFSVTLQITRRCNLKCCYCAESVATPELSAEDLKKIIDKLAAHGTQRIAFGGGEPLLREDALELAKYIHDKGIVVTLATNGFLLDEERLKKFKPYIDNVRMSINGTPGTHNAIANNPQAFARLENAVKTASRLGIPVVLCFAAIEKNIDNLVEVSKICKDWGVQKLAIFSLIKKGRGLTQKGVSENRIREEIQKCCIPIYFTPFTNYGQCVMVKPDGEFVGTAYYENKSGEYTIGNVLTDDLDALWGKYPFRQNFIAYYRGQRLANSSVTENIL
ncbi:radical SAM protein [Candidatus Woesearchaeota archaeon]|nr:radical SAM protein [Candidatus Woesearchaeota archaeon]